MCQHLRTIGDNYGETCADCGEPLRGFGEWAEGSRECLHGLWYDNRDGTETCGYCETTRTKEPEVKP